MKSILVLGATGLLGVPLSDHLENKGHRVFRHGHHAKASIQADISNFAQCHKILDDLNPDYIINLVALTDVDKCEKDPDLAYRINIKSVENILSWKSTHLQTKIIQISTDHIYDGPGPHAEDDIKIRNTYALTKYCAEHIALRMDACVLRINFFGKSRTPGRLSLSDWLVTNLAERKPIKLYTDIYFSPLSIGTLSQNIEMVVGNFHSGVFNLGCLQGMSKRDFAVLFAQTLGLSLDSATDAFSVDCQQGAARRPMYMRMDCGLFEATFGIKLPSLAQEINDVRKEYVREN